MNILRLKKQFPKTTALLLSCLMILTMTTLAFATAGEEENTTYSETYAEEPIMLLSEGTTAPWSEIPVEDEIPNTDIVVIPSDANALILMDTGAQSPRGEPGDVVSIVLPVAVNKEYLPSERYMLRNINVAPAIPTDTSVKNWPFDLIYASYTRHLDDMSYNSTAEIWYDFRISEFATKGVYPINFEVNASVWRYDEVNGTSITEDVTFKLCVYVTIVKDGNETGVQTSFGALQLAAINESGVYDAPVGQPGQALALQIPIINKGGTLSNVTISPVISSSVEEFPFVADNTNYGISYDYWETGKVNYADFYFTVSDYATTGNKPVRLKATYFENGVSASCEFVTYIYISNGYVKPDAPKETINTAMSVMVQSYKIFVDGAEVSGLMAGDDATLRLKLINNAKYDTSYKNVASLSLINSKALTLTVGSSDAAYVAAIKPGETAEVEFKISVKRDAEVGPTTIGVNLAYETGDHITGNAAQSIMLPVSQPMDIVLDEAIVYGTPTTDKPVSINLNMVNMGRAKALNICIFAMDGISMTENYYGGDLPSAGTLSADFQVNCAKEGEFIGKLIVQYEDANGELYSQEVNVPLNVAVPKEPEPTPIVPETADEPEQPIKKSILPWWLWLIILVWVAIIILIISIMIAKRTRGRWEKAYSTKAGGGKK